MSSGLKMLVVVAALVIITMPMVSSFKKAAGEEKKVINIGYCTDLTGPVSGSIAGICHGTEDYFKSVNDTKGGIDGVKLNFEWYDVKYDLDKAMSIYRMIKDHIMIYDIIISGHALAMRDIVIEDQMPCYIGSSTSECAYPANPWMYLLSPTYADCYPAFLLWAKQTQITNRPIRVGAIVVDAAFGWSAVRALPGWCKDNGMEYVGQEVIPLNPLDVSGQLMKVKGKNPDYILVSGTSPQVAVCVRDAKAMGIKVPLVGGLPAGVGDILRICGPEIAEGYMRTTEEPLWPPFYKSKVGDLVLELVKKYRPTEPAGSSYLKGVAEGLLLEKVVRLTLEKVPYNKLTRKDFKYHGFDRVANFDAGGYQTVTFTATDHRGHQLFLETVKNGQPAMLNPKPVMAPDMTKYLVK